MINKLLTTSSILTLSTMVVTHAASVIYVDFGADPIVGAPTASETYNTISPSTTGATTSLEGTGENFTNLLDTVGTPTGVGLHVLATSSGGDVRAGNTGSLHDSISGLDNNALGDGIWVNSGTGTTPATVSFVLSFSSLTAAAYDIQLTSGSGVQRDTTWSITTGTGDTSTFTAATASTSGIGSWSTVAPAGGDIVITGTYTANAAFDTSTVNFVSLTAVPEPSSVALLAVGGLALTLRRRRK